MPALPAGGPGAEAPREQPASPTTDDAPPPVKQEYTGAQGAEIAGSADSASAGPGASDSLAVVRAHMTRDPGCVKRTEHVSSLSEADC